MTELPDFSPADIIGSNKEYIPKYELVIHNDGAHSLYYLSLILKALGGLSRTDADMKAYELSTLGSVTIRVAPLETVEVIAKMLYERADITCEIRPTVLL